MCMYICIMGEVCVCVCVCVCLRICTCIEGPVTLKILYETSNLHELVQDFKISTQMINIMGDSVFIEHGVVNPQSPQYKHLKSHFSKVPDAT